MEERRVNQIIPNEESGTVLAIITDQTLWNSLRNEGISVVRGHAQIPHFCCLFPYLSCPSNFGKQIRAYPIIFQAVRSRGSFRLEVT